MSLLTLENVGVSIHGQRVLSDINLSLDQGKVLGIIGESGSGKSMTALAIMSLLPSGASCNGAIRFDGQELTSLDDQAMCRIRGDQIGMVFQEPMTALNPVHTIGNQVMECIRLHQTLSRAAALDLTKNTLTRCGLPPQKYSLDRYPHELSGGQRQRVIIAMAIALRPKLLIADEPTTALDVTTQAEILDLLRNLQQSEGLALMLISHDLAVVASMANDIAIMKDGHIVDMGSTDQVFESSNHPYTRALIAVSDHVPERNRAIDPPSTDTTHTTSLLTVKDLVCDYPIKRRSLFERRRYFRAVDAVSFTVNAGESVGLVGESGCGKSTLARALLGLEPVRSGSVQVGGQMISGGADISRLTRRDLQVVFQDPYGSFNPRHRVARLIAEPLFTVDKTAEGLSHEQLISEMLQRVELSAADADKYIHEFSGGQRQRIAIARALITRPRLIILDEAVSALDVSVRATILDLLAALSDQEGLAYLFISHDLSVVRNITDRVIVMQNGRIVDQGDTRALFNQPHHHYTRELLNAAPVIPERYRAPAGVSPINPGML